MLSPDRPVANRQQVQAIEPQTTTTAAPIVTPAQNVLDGAVMAFVIRNNA